MCKSKSKKEVVVEVFFYMKKSERWKLLQFSNVYLKVGNCLHVVVGMKSIIHTHSVCMLTDKSHWYLCPWVVVKLVFTKIQIQLLIKFI